MNIADPWITVEINRRGELFVAIPEINERWYFQATNENLDSMVMKTIRYLVGRAIKARGKIETGQEEAIYEGAKDNLTQPDCDSPPPSEVPSPSN